MTKAKFREISISSNFSLLYYLIMCGILLILAHLGASDTVICLLLMANILFWTIMLLIQYNKAKRAQARNVPPPIHAVHEYLEIKKQHEDNEARLAAQKLVIVKEYTMIVLSPYMKEADVITVCENIQAWMSSDEKKLKAVSTDGRLASIDLRHFAWNVGERFGWNGEKRALFIKMVFPVEMKDIEVATIRRNLRQARTCIIDLDIPAKGDYKFTFKTKDIE